MAVVVKVFLASPSDVAAERDIVCARAEEFNRNYSDAFGIYLRVVRWEDLPPTARRAQDHINVYAHDCELFIGILGTRWGSNSGEYSSGFYEEWTIANKRRVETGAPEMAMFFKDLDPDRMSDPGQQLEQVLEFKNSIGDSNFYKVFSSPNELANSVDSVFARFAVGRRADSMPVANSPTAVASKYESGVTDSVDASSIVSVLAAVTTGSGTAMSQLDFWAKLRLWLYAQATYGMERDDITIPVHEANYIYIQRKYWDLMPCERWMMIRSMLVDPHCYTPGWYWIETSGVSTRDMLWRSFKDSGAKKAAAALLIDDTVIDVEPEAIVAALLDPEITIAIATLLSHAGTAAHLAIIAEVKPKLESGPFHFVDAAEFAIRQRIDAKFSNEELAGYVARNVKDAEPVLLDALREPSEHLISALIYGIADSFQRGTLALVLAKAGKISASLAKTLLVEESHRIREAGVRALLAHGQPFTRAELTLIFPKETDGTKTTHGLLASGGGTDISAIVKDGLRLLPPDQLGTLLSFFNLDGDFAYSTLCERHWDSVVAFTEQQLDTDFQKFIDECDAAAKMSTGMSVVAIWSAGGFDTVEIVRANFLEIALYAVKAHGHAKAASWAIKYGAPTYPQKVREAALALLLTTKHPLDYSAIADAFSAYPASFAEAVLPEMIATIGVHSQLIVSVAAHESVAVRRRLVTWLTDNWSESYEVLIEPLLLSEADNVRKIAAHVLVRCLGNKALEDLLNRQVSRERYFYDVVTILDLGAYGVAPYRDAQLAKVPL